MPPRDSRGGGIWAAGQSYWDGNSWRPLGPQPPAAPVVGMPPAYGLPPARRSSPWPAILIGCGVVLLALVIIGILGTVAMFNSPDFQRSFCEGYTNNNANISCPFSPRPATP